MLSKVLSDPEAMQTILKIAGEMKGGTSEHPSSPPGGTVPGETPAANANAAGNPHPNAQGEGDAVKAAKRESNEAEENRIKLLYALKPYLNEDRREKTDVMIRILKLLRFTDLNELTKLLGGMSK